MPADTLIEDALDGTAAARGIMLAVLLSSLFWLSVALASFRLG
jgi:hypothetical protein